ncbi:calcium/sodium antiporter [Alcanivorax sp. JB21]|uniref:calcium/sodium antiporter n=1 Tax=Alcanivorax limicola TaxID=2874102 RepID=UPI001CBD6A9E|nr:calcium/sodium antiporter [Alcanivorax limicola]MBZ2189623.1 calcium/sodium antiporter [Alcanivorax limicola]
MLPALLACVFGLVILVWSADRFVGGAAGLALRLGMTPMTIGLTLVAFGTSAPEILVSATASLTGSSDLAIGNALGSNIANIGMVLAVTLLVRPILITPGTRQRDLPAYLLVAAVTGLILLDGVLTRREGTLLLGMLCIMGWLLWQFRQRDAIEDPELPAHGSSALKDWGLFISGLVMLLVSARLLVWGAVELALSLGVSETVIGLTLVAAGTSLPELAASVAAALRGHADLAIGNIVGSNIMNLVAVLPVPALLAPGLMDPALVSRDFPAMLALSAVLLILVLIAGRRRLGRGAGLVLLAGYTGYLTLLAAQSL